MFQGPFEKPTTHGVQPCAGVLWFGGLDGLQGGGGDLLPAAGRQHGE